MKALRRFLSRVIFASCALSWVAAPAAGHGLVDDDSYYGFSDPGPACTQGGEACQAYRVFVPSLPILTGIDFVAWAYEIFGIVDIDVYLRVNGELTPTGVPIASAQTFVASSGRWIDYPQDPEAFRIHVDFPSTPVVPGQAYLVEFDMEDPIGFMGCHDCPAIGADSWMRHSNGQIQPAEISLRSLPEPDGAAGVLCLLALGATPRGRRALRRVRR